MKNLKHGLIVVAVLASTWAAGQITDRWISFPALVLDQAGTTPAASPAPAPPDQPPAEVKGKPPAAIEEVSNEEMQKELERAQKALTGTAGTDKGQGEFRSAKPLPADMPIGLPSDF